MFCRETLEDDVRFKVLYCGVCHTDLHSLKNDWGYSIYPLVPGYELYFHEEKEKTFNYIYIYRTVLIVHALVIIS